MVYEDSEQVDLINQGKELADAGNYAFLDILITTTEDQNLRGLRKRAEDDDISYNLEVVIALTPAQFARYINEYKFFEFTLALSKNAVDEAYKIRDQILNFNKDYILQNSIRIFTNDELETRINTIFENYFCAE